MQREKVEQIVREVVGRLLCVEGSREDSLRRELVVVGRKLWQREYVDGNGGNLSCRLDNGLILCTPTMVSKADLAPEQLVVVDLGNHRVSGSAEQTSEIRLHLEIYKAVPEAQAVVHCHPPHATAYAIAGLCPPGEVLPECEMFAGPIPIAPYETPGTQEFAETVLPYVRHHNAILLANHGVVCWADTATHAEWLVEVLDTYCRTLILAAQLGRPVNKIPREKLEPLLAVKRKLGLPDPRIERSDAAAPCAAEPAPDIETLVRTITASVLDTWK